MISSFSFSDGEEEKTVSVLLNGEESSMSFIDPDADTVRINLHNSEQYHQWSVNSCFYFSLDILYHLYLPDLWRHQGIFFFGKVPVFKVITICKNTLTLVNYS